MGPNRRFDDFSASEFDNVYDVAGTVKGAARAALTVRSRTAYLSVLMLCSGRE